MERSGSRNLREVVWTKRVNCLEREGNEKQVIYSMRVESPPNKIEPLEEKKAFSSIDLDQRNRQSHDEYSQSENVAQPRLSLPCFPESIRLTFTSPKLEKIYQQSNKRERLKSNLFCASFGVIANVVLLFFHAFSELGTSSQENNIAVISGISIAIFSCLFLACFRRKQCFPGSNVSMFVWLYAALEALLILGLGESPLTPNDLVGTFTFLAFLAFILLPMRLRFCIFWVTVLAVIHSIIVGVSSEKMDQYSKNQVRGYLLRIAFNQNMHPPLCVQYALWQTRHDVKEAVKIA